MHFVSIVLIMAAGAALGAFGQFIRAVLGLAKLWQASTDRVDFAAALSGPRFFGSLLVGGVAGLLSCLMLADAGDGLTRALALTAVAAGYAGADAIEGMMAIGRRALGGAVILLAVVAATLAPGQARAADAADCHSPTDVRIFIEARTASVVTAIYRGDDAAAFLDAMADEIGPPPPELMIFERTIAVGTYTSNQHIEIVFYAGVAGMECAFWDMAGPRSSLDATLKAMRRLGLGA